MKTLDKIQQLACKTALNNMMQKGYVDICCIREICKMMEISHDSTSAYATLSLLHCVHFKDMEKELRDNIPVLVMECLGGDSIYMFHSIGPVFVDIQEENSKKENSKKEKPRLSMFKRQA